MWRWSASKQRSCSHERRPRDIAPAPLARIAALGHLLCARAVLPRRRRSGAAGALERELRFGGERAGGPDRSCAAAGRARHHAERTAAGAAADASAAAAGKAAREGRAAARAAGRAATAGDTASEAGRKAEGNEAEVEACQADQRTQHCRVSVG